MNFCILGENGTTFDGLDLLRRRPDEVCMYLLQRCNEVAMKLGSYRLACAAPASSHPSIQEAAPFVDSFMEGYGEAGEAQGVLNGSNFVETLLQLRSNFIAT